MTKILTATFAIGLLVAATSCGSDEKSADTTSPSQETVTIESTSDTTTAETVAAETVAEAPAAGGLSELQLAAYAQTVAAAAAVGITFDDACFSEQFAKFSDADAQAILDAGPTGEPALSDEGLAITEELQQCPFTQGTTG